MRKGIHTAKSWDLNSKYYDPSTNDLADKLVGTHLFFTSNVKLIFFNENLTYLFVIHLKGLKNKLFR